MDWNQLETLFDEALDLGSSEREAFLKERCGDDLQLMAHVLELLEKDRTSGGFLEVPALEEVAETIAHEGPRVRPGDRFGRWEVVDLLGVGGMGTVHKARNLESGELGALKTLSQPFPSHPEMVRRFKREAKTLAGLHHLGIVQIHEISQAETGPYLVMELVEGETLASRLLAGPLPLEEVVDYASQLARALEAAHRKGIIHRDLKASNVIVTREGNTKLLDFGLAKFRTAEGVNPIADLSSESLTQPGTLVGTLSYMSPEQAKNGKVDRRSDIFSLGVLIYQMATGELPFQGTTAFEVISRVCHRQPLPMARFNLAASERLEDIVWRCLQKKPSERYSSAGKLLDELQGQSPSRRWPWSIF